MTWAASYRSGFPSLLIFAKTNIGDPQDINTLYAALSIRINLDVDVELQRGRSLQSKLVESHLRVVLAIPEHREFMRACTPSEPLLAEAARLLLKEVEDPLTRVPYLLLGAFSSGFLTLKRSFCVLFPFQPVMSRWKIKAG
ncbi:hypothetical protein H0H81_001752 [Sphagnurus paluster]|uniref:Uncharacterized protein n=1 Tax=Sphagnurus paluster TaxID=117069 RepID=A0A9P7KHX4_9AGAR|nr:hypothetical protein H0H81_001752 [Sphagnurus paluster]